MKLIYIFLTNLLLGYSITHVKAQTISFPDENFKEALIAEGLDANNDGNIQKSEIADVKKLHVNNANISSVVGIKNFTNLENFAFLNNDLKTVDLEGMKNLKFVYGNGNQITELKLKGCTMVEVIFMDQNQLSTVDLTGLTELRDIRINVNKLQRIDLSNKPKLEKVQLFRNKLIEFKANGSLELKDIDLSNNLITEVDLRLFTKLVLVDFTNNPLRKINVTGLSKLETLYCEPISQTSYITQLNTCGLISLKELKW
ncbi:leucine-rich repeat domain-containing protein [Chitinophaga tropicalis]|uniref:Leucine-rich repeat domain-containing protein n=1 Tax=Chitinophaga tropicalis TaxID=2683588 RepID=A0A7K1TX99_9BACT|nr:hypothetical protein [Chitinophaga tropicalis]MVT06713.1 hypothetical protein [Chitinophaga tropicalis]